MTVSKSERLPLVKEFALRLLYVHEIASPELLNTFFKFSKRELSILIQDLKRSALIDFREQQLVLTESAREKFSASDGGTPYIGTVEAWHERFAIDFVSFSLIHWIKRPDGFRVFHDIESPSVDKISQSRDEAKSVLAGSFHEFVQRFKSSIDEDERARLSLYGISSIEPGDRFSFPLTVDFSVDPRRPQQCRHGYTDFRSDAALDKRAPIVNSVAAKIRSLASNSRFGGDPVEVFCDRIEDPFFSTFCSDSTFDLEAFLEAADGRQCIAYDDGASVATVGGFMIEKNRSDFLKLLDQYSPPESAAKGEPSSNVFWGKPTNLFWFRDSESIEFAKDVRRYANRLSENPTKLSLVINSRFENPKELNARLKLGNHQRLFSDCLGVALTPTMASCEILIMPKIIGAINFYFWRDDFDVPIPIGFMTRDPHRLALLAQWALREWTGFGRKVQSIWSEAEDSKLVRVSDIQARDGFHSLMSAYSNKRGSGTTLSLHR